MKTKPFTGELMTCVVCDRQARSHPQMQSQWRYLDLDGHGFYVCPDELPPDGTGLDKFKTAYDVVLAVCLNEIVKQAGQPGVAEIEAYRRQRRQQEQSKPRGFGNG